MAINNKKKEIMLEKNFYNLNIERQAYKVTQIYTSARYYGNKVYNVKNSKTSHGHQIFREEIEDIQCFLNTLYEAYPAEYLFKELKTVRKVNGYEYLISGAGIMCYNKSDCYFETFDFRNREKMFQSMELIKSDIENAKSESDKVQDIKSGVYNVLLEAGTSGIIAHECGGHVFESDIRFERDAGERLTIPEFSVIDDGKLKYMGYMPLDDEGNEAERTCTIKNGKIYSYLTDERMARKYNIKNNAHSRTGKPGEKRQVRMTNTYICPTKHSVQVSDTYVWVKNIRDTELEEDVLKIYPGRCYFVQNGEYVPVRIRCLSLDIVKTLDHIFSVGNNLKFYSSVFGGCLKGNTEELAVSHGGPSLFIKNMNCST